MARTRVNVMGIMVACVGAAQRGLVQQADARWNAQIERSMANIQALPEILARRVQQRSPQLAQVLLRLQVDAPLIFSFASACLGVHVLASNGVRLRFFSVGKPLEASNALGCVGHVLGHGSWAHLHGNMLMLLLVGPPCEIAFGPARLSKVMLGTALGSQPHCPRAEPQCAVRGV
eukprot:3366130-Prymnesium_polylepis.1